MTRAEKYKLRYRAIRNKLWDAKTAKKAQTWSDERILKELGVKVPKSTPKLRELPRGDAKERAQKRAKLKLTKFKYLVEIGVEPKKAIKFKGDPWKKITARAKRTIRKKDKVYGGDYDKERDEQWSRWSRDENLPQHWDALAQSINIKNGFDMNANYGYAVVYHAYVHHDTVDVWEKQIDPIGASGDIYRYLKKVSVM